MSKAYIVCVYADESPLYLSDCTGTLTTERKKAKRFASKLYAERASQRSREKHPKLSEPYWIEED